MNYLGYFWDPMNGYAEQHDIHEGIVLSTNNYYIDDVFREHLIGVPMFRAEGYKYCNVACFYRVDVEVFPIQSREILLSWQESGNMKEFGEYVIIIKDVNEFMKRVDMAMRKENFKYCAGDVEYYSNVEPNTHSCSFQADSTFDLRSIPEGQKFDSFYKTYKYKNQNEWRISLFRGLREEGSFTLDVGSLHDIAYLTDIRHMSDDFRFLLNHNGIYHNWDYGHRGNTARNDLRDMFIALGDYQAKMILVTKTDILYKLPPPQRGDFLERFRNKINDTVHDLANGAITKEDFYTEIERLQSVLERSHIRIQMPNE